jgi:hypothetical protein
MTTDVSLNYEASAGTNNLQVSSTLPDEVVQVLQNARFVSTRLSNTLTDTQYTFHDISSSC